MRERDEGSSFLCVLAGMPTADFVEDTWLGQSLSTLSGI